MTFVNTRYRYNILQILSVVFHPIFIPVYSILLYLNLSESILNIELYKKTLYIIISGTVILPLITILFLKEFNFIKNIELKDSKDRLIPIISSIIYIYATVKVLLYFGITGPIATYLMGIIITLSWVLLLSIRIKVSLHTASISSTLGLYIYLSTLYNIDFVIIIITTTLILGLISTVRIKLGAHSYTEVLTGVLFGIIPQVGYLLLY